MRGLTVTALVVALAALGVGLWALLRGPQTDEATASPTPQQVEDAKTKVCDAFTLVYTAVNGRANADPGNEPEATIANARLAASFGSMYLLERLGPATPPELADAIRVFADHCDEAAMASLAGVGADDPEQAERISQLEPLNQEITGLCA